MFAGVCRIAAALAITGFTVTAYAQVIPPGDLAGRERQRFQQPPTAPAVSSGPAVSLPSTEAPPGAEGIFLVVRRVEIVGSTVYGPEQFAPLYQDVVGHR